ncbi:MAG: histidinol-phosphatase HisJ family protein [Ignavibacteria bacterium]|nr:histidinol-phosphatase HisJ family protein [Ignavibacteria bacterium]
MIVDYHTHSSLCKHATGTVEDYVRKAIERGFDEIGVSDHIPMPPAFDERHRMSLDEYYSIYAPQVGNATERFGSRIRVRRGIEADFFEGTQEWVAGFVKENDFDYVIGSIHFLGTWGVDDPIFVHRYEEKDVDRIYEEYFRTVQRAARSGLFDIVAHCDLVKKFGYRPTHIMDDLLREVLGEIKNSDLCLEINTSGLYKPVREVYPSEFILSIASDLRIPLTLGSDAHAPEEVGRDFDVAIELIERYGRGTIAVFEKRQRREVGVKK